MARDSFWSQPGAVHFSTAHPLQLDPPKSREVLRALGEYLTPPLRVASGRVIRPASAVAASHLHPSRHWAYRECARIIKEHSKSFYMSALLMPAAKRHGIMALYAFCRTSDDLVDGVSGTDDRTLARREAERELDRWAAMTAAHDYHASEHPVVLAWGDTRIRHSIPHALPEELLSGVRMDLTIDRYETWNDLWVYCYKVASTVGLMSMYITGAEGLEAVPHAVQLGVALQLTNILRDVGEDARGGRIYLPAEDMARFGYTEDELMRGEINPRFVRLMDFEIARARALYDAAWPGIALLPSDSRLAVAAAAAFYRGILDRIVAAGYDVFTRRAHLTTGNKLRLVPGIWWQTRRNPGRSAKHST